MSISTARARTVASKDNALSHMQLEPLLLESDLLEYIFTFRLPELPELPICDRGEESMYGMHPPTHGDPAPKGLKSVRGCGQLDMISVRHAANNAVPAVPNCKGPRDPFLSGH
jgi:hypothetical protein